MRRELKLLVSLFVLGAVGFASASIVNRANASSADTATGATTTTGTTPTTGTTATIPPPTVTVTTANTVTRTVVVAKKPTALLCHRNAHGRFLTIRVRLNLGVLAAHVRHGDATGRCTAAKIRLMKKQLLLKRG